MVKSLNRLTIFKLLTSFQIAMALLILANAKPSTFTDSPRYFLLDNKHHIFNELWAHSGSFLQTTLYSISSDNSVAVYANIFIWILTSFATNLFILKNFLNDKKANLTTLLSVLIFTSNVVANWLVSVSSESIGISFLISIIIPLFAIMLGYVDNKKYYEFYFLPLFFLLAISKPIWAALIAPFLLILLAKVRNKTTLAIFVLIFFLSSFSALRSAKSPYDNTGLTHQGWYSITRAYGFGMENRLGSHSVDALIECPQVYSLVLEGQRSGTTTPIYSGIKKALETCPEFGSKLNKGKLNTPLELLTLDIQRSGKLFLFALSTMAKPAIYSVESITNNWQTFNFLLHTCAIALIPGILIATFNNKSEFTKILISFSYLIGSGFLIFIQDGIEWERHMLPTTLSIVILTWMALISIFTNSKENR